MLKWTFNDSPSCFNLLDERPKRFKSFKRISVDSPTVSSNIAKAFDDNALTRKTLDENVFLTIGISNV